MGKTILILGNGFDLAHGLPTGYKHFLEFCNRINIMYTFAKNKGNKDEFFNMHLKEWDIHDLVKNELKETFENMNITNQINENGVYSATASSSNVVIEEIKECLTGNIWFCYFDNLFKGNLLKGVNWIDFES